MQLKTGERSFVLSSLGQSASVKASDSSEDHSVWFYAVVVHPPQGSLFFTFYNAFLVTTVVKSDYFSHCIVDDFVNNKLSTVNTLKHSNAQR